MKKVVKLTENEISKIVDNVLNEVSWRTTNQVRFNYKDEVNALEKIGYKINDILDKVYDDDDTSNYGWDYVNIHNLQEPIKSKITEFIQYLSNFKDYADRKAQQIKKFEQHSKDDFKREYNMSMSDYEDNVGEKENNIFDRYINNNINSDGYDEEMRALQPEQNVVDRINGLNE